MRKPHKIPESLKEKPTLRGLSDSPRINRLSEASGPSRTWEWVKFFQRRTFLDSPYTYVLWISSGQPFWGSSRHFPSRPSSPTEPPVSHLPNPDPTGWPSRGHRARGRWIPGERSASVGGGGGGRWWRVAVEGGKKERL